MSRKNALYRKGSARASDGGHGRLTPETKVLNTNRINIVISAMMDEKTSRGENPRNSHSSKQKAKLPKAV